MQTINIHGKTVKIDEDSHSSEIAAQYLSKNPNEARAFFDEAHRDHVNGVAHFELPHTTEHINTGHHFTLIHNGDGTYNLRKRTGY
jgi:hypothetical protein